MGRCPSCGVEHDTSADSVCEACATPLRAWCRVHGREFGWLDGAACARCVEDAARPRPAVRRDPRPTAPAASGEATLAEAGAAGAMPPTAEPLLVAAAPSWKKPGVVERGFVMLMVLLLSTAGGVLVGVLAGLVFTLVDGGDFEAVAQTFAIGGGIAGVLYGGLACGHYVQQINARSSA